MFKWVSQAHAVRRSGQVPIDACWRARQRTLASRDPGASTVEAPGQAFNSEADLPAELYEKRPDERLRPAPRGVGAVLVQHRITVEHVVQVDRGVDPVPLHSEVLPQPQI